MVHAVNDAFHYSTAFSRNIGWLTETEQEVLRNKKVAIAGLGGVGGAHLITLTRLGIGQFNISDLDIFELANFNRQSGAALSHINRPKTEVMAELATDINAELDINIYPEGINEDNIDAFLNGVDLYVDGLDFFALDARKAVFAACAEKGIPAITAAPLGMGVALLCFIPGKMTFEEYFRLNGQSEDEQLLRFLLGLSPAMLQMSYLVDQSRVDLDNHKGPSTPMACDLCSGLAATNALKILLSRGKIIAAPKGLHFDAFRNKLSQTWRPWGNNNWIQRIGIEIARKKLSEKTSVNHQQAEDLPLDTPIARILNLARWSPSGDNTQPWEFEIKNTREFLIYAHDDRESVIYDLDGHASQTAVGALLETIQIAASGENLDASFQETKDSTGAYPIIKVNLLPTTKQQSNPLLPFIKIRCTQRRAFSTQPLSNSQKQQLEAAVGESYKLIWIDSRAKKWQLAKLLFHNAWIRLTTKEAYDVHTHIIEWNAQFSESRIPDQAIGLGGIVLSLMKWTMHSWARVQMMNRFFAGTWLPRIQLDVIPALRCASHFIIIADKKLDTNEDYFNGGRALQRFWLTTAKMGLQFQPEMTPLIFSRYIKEKRAFTTNNSAFKKAESLAVELDKLVGQNSDKRVFMGRIGFASIPLARSVRHPVNILMKK